MTTQQLLSIALVVAFAFTVEAALGFGATVIAVALGSLLLPIDQILPAFVPVNVALSAVLVAKNHRSVDGSLLGRKVFPLVLLGLPVGILVFRSLDERLLKIVFGAFVVGLSALELTRRAPRPGEAPEPTSRAVSAGLLIAGGMIHGAFATGGPMVVYVLGRTFGTDKARFRATLSVLWLTLNSILVVTYALSGKLSAGSAKLSAAFVLSLGAGLVLGEVAFRRIAPERFRTFIFGMLAVAGAVLIARNV